MKIGIYGDSFACTGACRYPKINNDTPWMTLIETPEYNINNFALSGTSMYWSYKNYKDNHTKFDKNIFLATASGRIYIPWNEEKQHWTGYSITQENHKQNDKHISGFNEVYGYFTKIYNSKEHDLYKKLMINDIMSNNNSLVIDNTDILLKISLREIEYYKSLNLNLPWHNDNRWCHLSQEGNNFLAERIKVWLETGTFNINDWEESCPLPTKEKAFSYFLENY